MERLLGRAQARAVRISTFHRFCLEILRSQSSVPPLKEGFRLCSELDAEQIAREILSEAGEGRRSPGRFLRDKARYRAASVLEEAGGTGWEGLPLLVEAYRRRLATYGMIDLDDLEMEALTLLRREEGGAFPGRQKPAWIFVDEYQDTNPLQVEILKALLRRGDARICAIGDPDQAIYGFRGADVRAFHRFREDTLAFR